MSIVRSRSQAWMPDELILALDLYMSVGPNPGPKATQALSDTLRAIPIERELAGDPTFRSPQSVAYKLQNFVAIDPTTANAGFPHGGKGDVEIWGRFAEDPQRLQLAAAAIRANLAVLSEGEAEVEEEEINDAEEGRILTRLHRKRERSSKLRKAKKKAVLETTGRLACEACDLDFGERYGSRGEGFIECHHIIPLHTLKPRQRTRIEDLALLCSNCHRILHLRRPWLSVEAVKGLVQTSIA
ncbi:MAG TPA: HNH endonuclease [Solirubrobacterales bacterium]|nr:HNH endonuclease [Solirubrobacterales bacterium]